MTSRNIFSIENQMQVFPLARNPREKKNTKRNEKHMSSFCNLYPITAMQFMFGKLFPEIMFMVHVVFTCLWFMLNGLERFCHFSLGVSSQSPIPSSCLEYGGLQCSHIFIICCVLYCFQFSFMVYFISWCLLMCYLCSFIFIYVHLFSFIFIYFYLL